MAQTLRLKRSSVPGRVPTTATLQTGEIAINTADGLVYIRKDDDSIIPLLGANTTVTGSVVLLGSIEATSFTGSFNGPINGTLSKSVSNGDGIVSFLFDGSDNVTVSLDTGSNHFRNAVIDLIDTNAPSIIAQDTTGAGGIDLSYNSDTGALSGSLLYSDIQLGSTTIQLGNSAASVTGFNLENTRSTGSFSGSFTGDFSGNFTGTLAASASAGPGILPFTFDGTSNATVGIDSASYEFRKAVHDSIIIVDTYTSSGVNLEFNEIGNQFYLSAHLQSPFMTVGSSYLQLSGIYESLSDLTLINTTASGSFTGSFVGNLEGTASWAENAITASYSTVSVSSSYADFALTSTSASHALIADYALAANVDTGSLLKTGSVVDDTITLTKADGTSFDLTVDNVASASFASTAATASYAATTTTVIGLPSGSYLTTGSISNATITLTKADESTFDLTVNNVANATSASYALSSSYAVSSSYAEFTAFAQDAISASYAATASSADAFLVRNDATINGDLTVEGIVTAREFHTTFISASIVYSSGSTKFGDTADDIHEFTGSVIVSGSIDSDDITIDQWGSVSASLALLSGSIAGLDLQQVTDNGNTTTNGINIVGTLDTSGSAVFDGPVYFNGVPFGGTNYSRNNIILPENLGSIYWGSHSAIEYYKPSGLLTLSGDRSLLSNWSAGVSIANQQGYHILRYWDSGSVSQRIIMKAGEGGLANLEVEVTGSFSVLGEVTVPDVTIDDWGSVSASLASLNASSSALTLQQVTDNGNQTTNHVSISSSLNVSQSIYSKGEEVLDFAVAMAIALG